MLESMIKQIVEFCIITGFFFSNCYSIPCYYNVFELVKEITPTCIEPRCEKTGLWGFPTRSDTNRAVQLQKIAKGLKFRIYKEEGLYYLCSENKGADQLRSYCAADLRLCFSKCKKPVFSKPGSIMKLVRGVPVSTV